MQLGWHNSGLSKAQANALYVNVAGDTMTGALTISAGAPPTVGLTINSDIIISNGAGIALGAGGDILLNGADSTVHVNGLVRVADGSAGAPTFTFVSDLNTGIFRAADDVLGFATGGAERARFDASGHLELVTAGAARMTSGAPSVSIPAYAFKGDPNTGIYNQAADVLGFVTAGVERGFFNASGHFTINGGNGSSMKIGWESEEIILSTVSTITDSTANLLLATGLVLGVVLRVTQAINVATSIDVGDPTTANRFRASFSPITLGSISASVRHWDGAVTTTGAGPTQTADAKIRITANGGQPTAGKVRVVVFYLQFIAPTS